MKGRKAIIVSLVTMLLAGGIIAGAALLRNNKSSKFAADGYVLEVEALPTDTSVSKLAFSSGTNYETKFPSSYKYKDVAGNTVTVDKNSFIHYSEGSVSAMNNGVVIDPTKADNGYIDFYQLGQGMVLTNNGRGYEIDNNHSTIPFNEILWTLDEDTAMVSSRKLDLLINDVEIGSADEYLEVRWVDSGIVQIAGEDDAWQVVSSDAKIRLASGNYLDLGEKALTNDRGDILVALSEMDADLSSGINVSSVSAEDWTPPAFKIETIDGEDGISGEEGKEGEVGETGEDGEDGEVGKLGEVGSTGAAGAPGKKGSSSQSKPEDQVNSATLGTIRVSDFNLINLTSAELTLSVSDVDSTLTENSGRVEIRNTKTNKVVWSSTFDTMAGEIFTFDQNNEKGPLDVLSPNEEYELIVKNDYSITINNTVNTGTKTFVDRIFTTPAEGLTGTVTFVDQDTISVTMDKSGYSQAESYALVLTIDGKQYVYPESDALAYSQVKTAMLELEDILQDTNISDKEYTIEIYSSTNNSSNICWTHSTDDGEVFVGESTSPATVKKSSQVLTGKTLKKKPVINGVTATLTGNGYYELSTGIVADTDNAITKYKYTVIDPDGTVVKVLESNNNTVNWYYGDTLKVGNYTVNCAVTYYDNQKYNELPEETGTISVTSSGTTALRFFEYKRDGSVLKDEMGTTVASYDGIDAVSATRIWGDLIVVTNGAEIDTSKPLKINISSSGDSTYTRQDWTVSVNAVQPTPGSYYIPIKLLGLQADTTYTLTVNGTVKTTVSNGQGSTNVTSKEKYIGTASVKTDKMAIPTDVERNSAAAFVIESLVNSEIPDGIVGFKLYTGNQYPNINSTLPASDFYEARATARAVEFTIYSQSRTELATIVKDLYDTSIFSTYQSEFENVQYTELEANHLMAGPLVDSQTGDLGDQSTNGYAVLYKSDFLKAGFSEDQLTSSKIIVEATALYDYSYTMENSLPAYRNNFLNLDAQHHNRTPLNVLTLTSAGSINGYLNYKFINLGERAPVLTEPAYKAITVTPLNNYNPTVSYVDSTLDINTTIGMKVQSNYLSTGQETEITYYCFTMDDWYEYCHAPSDQINPTGNGDLISDYEDKNAFVLGNNSLHRPLIRFKAVIDMTKFSGETTSQVPALYVVIADPNSSKDMALVNQCKKVNEVKDNDGKVISSSIYYEPLENNKYPIIYTDEITRGDCYVYGMTLKTLYGVSTVTADNPEPWTFPYSIQQYNSSQMYFGGTGMQRSEGLNVYREAPKVAAYLDHSQTTQNSAGVIGTEYFWKYIVYDPDNTMAFAKSKIGGSSNIVTYAGSDLEILKLISNQYILPDLSIQSLDYRLLNSSVSNITTYKNADMASAPEEVQATLRYYFLVNETKTLGNNPGATTDDAGTVHTFTVKVSDSENCTLTSWFAQSPYQVWIGSSGFSGKHTVGDTVESKARGEKLYADTRKASDMSADSGEHFAVGSVSQYYDRFLDKGPAGIEDYELKAVISSIEGTDGIMVNLEDPGEIIKEHLTGVYYEIYENVGTAEQSVTENGANLMQYGFYEFDRSSGATTLSIPINNVDAGKSIYMKLYAVYGSGNIGMNLDSIPTVTHKLIKNKHANELSGAHKSNPVGDFDYYAISDQGRLNYVASMNTYGNLTYYDKAYGSVFEIDDSLSIQDQEAAAGYQINMYNGNSSSMPNRPMYFLYTDSGSFTEDRIMVFEGLKETKIELKSGINTQTVEGHNDLIKASVPATIPSVKQYTHTVNNSLHEATMTLSFTEKVVETMNAYNLAQTDDTVSWFYYPEVFMKLYYMDGATPVYLDNSDNRYFDVSKNNLTGYKNNPITVDNYLTPTTPTSSEYRNRYTFRFDSMADTSVKLQVRNLDPEKTYYAEMYCYDKDGNEVKFVYGYNEIGTVWNGAVRSHWKDDLTTVNIGLSDRAGSSEFTVDYQQTNYITQLLQATYSLDYVGGYALEYSILDKDGNVVSIINPNYDPSVTDPNDYRYGNMVSLNMATVARLMGYGEKEQADYWYYEPVANQQGSSDTGTWKNYTYTRYYYLDSNENKQYFDQKIGTAANTPHEISFTADNKFLYKLGGTNGGNYKLGIQLKDLYGGGVVHITQDGQAIVSGNNTATAPFVVPSRNPINVNALITFTEVENEGYRANMTINVVDSGYVMAYKKTDGNIEYGNYDIIIEKQTGTSTTWAPVTLTYSPSRNQNNLFNQSKPYTTRFAVNEGERYRLKIVGVDLANETTGGENIVLFDSETATNTTIKDKLNITNLSKPNLNGAIGDFDITSNTFTVTARRANNLEKISYVYYTLYYMESDDGSINATGNMPIRFSAPNSKGDQSIQIPLLSLIEKIEADNTGISFSSGDLVSLSIEYYDGTTYLTETTFSFRYK